MSAFRCSVSQFKRFVVVASGGVGGGGGGVLFCLFDRLVFSSSSPLVCLYSVFLFVFSSPLPHRTL